MTDSTSDFSDLISPLLLATTTIVMSILVFSGYLQNVITSLGGSDYDGLKEILIMPIDSMKGMSPILILLSVVYFIYQFMIILRSDLDLIEHMKGQTFENSQSTHTSRDASEFIMPGENPAPGLTPLVISDTVTTNEKTHPNQSPEEDLHKIRSRADVVEI